MACGQKGRWKMAASGVLEIKVSIAVSKKYASRQSYLIVRAVQPSRYILPCLMIRLCPNICRIPTCFIDLEKIVDQWQVAKPITDNLLLILYCWACDNRDNTVLQHNNEIYTIYTTCINPFGSKIILRDAPTRNISSKFRQCYFT